MLTNQNAAPLSRHNQPKPKNMNYQTSVMLFDRKETSGNETYRETFATRADAEAAAQQWITGAFDGPTQITVEECEDGEEDGKILLELWNRKARG